MATAESRLAMRGARATRSVGRGRGRAGERGQGMVEFAVLFPVLVLLLLGIIQFGLVFHTYLTLEDGAHEGARAATIDGGTQTYAQVDQAVVTAMPTLNASDVAVSVNPQDPPRVQGQPVTVVVTYTLPIIVPIINGIVGSRMALTATSVMSVD